MRLAWAWAGVLAMCLAGCSTSGDDGSAGDTSGDSTAGDDSSDGATGSDGSGSGNSDGSDGGDLESDLYRFAIAEGALTAAHHPWPEDALVGNLLAHGDFDGDGTVDVLVASGDQVQVVLDVGASQEVVAWTVEPNEDGVVDLYVHGAAVVDFDGDGDDEVAVGCSAQVVGDIGVTEQPREYVYDHDAGAGMVPVPLPAFRDGLGNNSRAVVATADVSGDDLPDLVVGSGSFITPSASRQTLGYLPGDGALGFGDLVPLPYEPQGDIVELTVVGIALADVDGDGALDVLTANRVSLYTGGGGEPDPPVVVHTEIPGGTPLTHTTPIAGGADPEDWFFADVDGDQDQDLLAVDGGGGLMAWPGEGTGFGQGQVVVDLGEDVQSGNAFVVVTDATADGVVDLFAFAYHTAPMAFVGEGAGAFSDALQSPLDVRSELVPLALDIDGDGRREVLWCEG